MQAAHFYKKNTKSKMVFPKAHIACCAVLLCLLSATFFSMPNEAYSFSDEDQIYIPVHLDFDQLALQLNQEAEESHLQKESLAKTSISHDDWEKIQIEKGDTLKTIFRQLQIPTDEYRLLWKYSSKYLDNINPEQQLILQFSDDKKIEAVRFKKSILESYSFIRKDNKFVRQDQIREPRIRYQHEIVKMNGSLNNSLEKTNKDLNSSNIRNQISAALSSRINLQKAQKSDVIHLLIEEKYIDDTQLGFGNVLAAQYDGKHDSYAAYRYKSLDGSTDYYSPKVEQEYKTVRQSTNNSSFLRSPVPGARISSNFSHRRLHPILKTRRPHLGTDFAARTGTPILATGDGVIETSGYSKSNGNYIVINHGRIKTKYLHLHRRYVKAGQRISKGKTIGSVGSTGLSTGAHLHYELLVNGVHKNPLQIARYTPKAFKDVQVAVKTPGAIPSDERKRFFEQTRGIRLQFAAATRESSQKVAQTKNSPEEVKVANLNQKSDTRHN